MHTCVMKCSVTSLLINLPQPHKRFKLSSTGTIAITYTFTVRMRTKYVLNTTVIHLQRWSLP